MNDRKEVKTMQHQTLLDLALAHEIRERDIERAAIERRFSTPRPSIRRAVGRRVIAVGQRIASEPSPQLARSR
jgi:hypothetical protein